MEHTPSSASLPIISRARNPSPCKSSTKCSGIFAPPSAHCPSCWPCTTTRSRWRPPTCASGCACCCRSRRWRALFRRSARRSPTSPASGRSAMTSAARSTASRRPRRRRTACSCAPRSWPACSSKCAAPSPCRPSRATRKTTSTTSSATTTCTSRTRSTWSPRPRGRARRPPARGRQLSRLPRLISHTGKRVPEALGDPFSIQVAASA